LDSGNSWESRLIVRVRIDAGRIVRDCADDFRAAAGTHEAGARFWRRGLNTSTPAAMRRTAWKQACWVRGDGQAVSGVGLEEVRGLALDGEAATPCALVERGPEALVHERWRRSRAECG